MRRKKTTLKCDVYTRCIISTINGSNRCCFTDCCNYGSDGCCYEFFAYFFDQLSIGGFRYLSSSFIRFVPELSLEYARLL